MLVTRGSDVPTEAELRTAESCSDSGTEEVKRRCVPSISNSAAEVRKGSPRRIKPRASRFKVEAERVKTGFAPLR